MPFICKDKFEKHVRQHHGDDNLHVEAISNPEEAAHIAAVKLVLNTHLQEKMWLVDTQRKNRAEYIKNIINQKNIEHILHDAANHHLRHESSQRQILGRGL